MQNLRPCTSERNLFSVQEGCPNPWASCKELQHQGVQVNTGAGEEPHQRRAWLLGTLGTGEAHWKDDVLAFGNSAPSSGRQHHLCPLLSTPRGHLPSLRDDMMINLLSVPSSQQCSFLQVLVAIQGAGSLIASAFIIFMAMQCWEEISWVEGKILG